jgi:hypothetical protein
MKVRSSFIKTFIPLDQSGPVGHSISERLIMSISPSQSSSTTEKDKKREHKEGGVELSRVKPETWGVGMDGNTYVGFE